MKNAMTDYKNILQIVADSEVMQQQWMKYQKDFQYAQSIDINDTCSTVSQIMEILQTK